MLYGEKILVVEDEQGIRENIQELLEAKGFKVRTAANGKLGLQAAIDFMPNLVICDIMMPKMDGFKLLEIVRKTTSIQNIPFIFLTARIDKSDIRRGMELGADDFLTKPFTYKELLNAVETRLKRQNKIVGEYAKVKHELDTNIFSTYYHEFNTPLHGILGGLNLLMNARDTFSENQKHELLGSILKSGLRLNHSLANLMLFEEIKRAEVYTELLPMFSNGIATLNWVGKVRNELATTAREIYGRTADLVVDLQPFELKINQEYLIRIILELVDNSFKFSKVGQKVEVKGWVENDEYCISVIDTGRGFSLNSLEEIAPFQQFNRNKFEQQGLGIGLYLVKRLVEFNNGEIQILSGEGEGTRILMQVQLAQEPMAIEADLVYTTA
jgi:two-component system, sensor histidine kinase and response regulator